MTTRSLPALKAYLDGERMFRAGHLDSAMSALRRATEQDSTFALADYRYVSVEQWTPRAPSREVFERAMRHQNRLPERYRLLLRAKEAYLWRGAAAEAESLYRVVLRSHPDDAEAWFDLGVVLWHYAAPWGRPIAEAREALERSITLVPRDFPAYVQWLWLIGTEGRHAEVAAELPKLLVLEAGENNVVDRATLAFARHDTSAEREVLAELRKVRESAWVYFVVTGIGGWLGDCEGAIRVAQLLTDQERPPDWRDGGHLTIADLEMARGRRTAALDALHRVEMPLGVRRAALFLLSPAFNASRGELQSVQERITAQPATSPTDSIQRLYVLGLTSVRLGDAAAASRFAALLRKRGEAIGTDHGSIAGLASDLSLTVRADSAWRSGRATEALRLLEQRRPEQWWESAYLVAPMKSQSYERWMRAEILAGLGREREAIHWYAALGIWGPGNEQAYVGLSRARMAKIYERLGNPEAAVRSSREASAQCSNPKL
jgi:tetratricopeptide (TPR) repeat protein